MESKEFRHLFLKGIDHTGRFIVESKRTGIKYYVEPIGNPHVSWGDMDPATKKLTGSYGVKYKGSINEDESMITEENGFDNITILEPGKSPLAYINKIDEERFNGTS